MSFLPFMKKTYLYLLAIPVLMVAAGISSNQAVLIANSDRFPVMVNSHKLTSMQQAAAANDEPDADMSETVDGVTIRVIATPQKSRFHIWKTAVNPSEVRSDLVDKNGMIDDVHMWMNYGGKKTHLNAMADVLDFGSIYSIGDILIEIGEMLFLALIIPWVTLVIRRLFVNAINA